MRLSGGFFDGTEIKRPVGCRSIVLPVVETGFHFSKWEYDAFTGELITASTFVGYESDETKAKREAFWEAEYWNSLERESESSFV